jgi:Ca-activated chloride channel family protein
VKGYPRTGHSPNMKRPFRAPFSALLFFSASLLSQPSPQQPPAPLPFRSPNGQTTGWKLSIPGGRPLATPAIANGQVFVGGGFGSHEFYSFDALNGKLLWTYHTADDGPTAAVTEGDKVVFNTESCEIECITRNGKPLWKKWLGDPLMSMPAIADGVVYMAFPNSRGDARYYVAAFDLNTGKEFWRKAIPGEIITAPVLDAQRVYLSTIDGTLLSFDRRAGEQVYAEQRNATSAPAIWRGQTFFSRRETATVAKNGPPASQQNEVFTAQQMAPSAPAKIFAATRNAADYLDYEKRAKASQAELVSQSLDATVGFPGAVKGSANMSAAKANLGQASVHGIWAYQGSKSFIDRGRLYASMGNKVLCTDAESGKVLWTREFYPEKARASLDATLTPPAIVNGKVFVGSSFGDVFALSEETGAVLWKTEIGEPVVFQPAVAGGYVYVPTSRGSVFSLRTGDARDDGWLMWGASGAHNGLNRN